MCGFRGRFVLFCIYPAWCSVNFGSETWCLTLIWEKFSNHYYFKYCFCSFLFSFVAIPQSLDIVLLFRSFYLCLMVSQFSIHTSLSSEIFLFSHDSILMSPWKTLFIHSMFFNSIIYFLLLLRISRSLLALSTCSCIWSPFSMRVLRILIISYFTFPVH